MSTDGHDTQILGLISSVQETILETTPNPYVLKNVDCVYVYVNKAFADFLGKEKKEVIGKTDRDLFPVDEAEKYIAGDKEVMNGGQQQKEEWKVEGGKGLIWLQVLKTPVLDIEGNVVGVLCSVADISKMKAATTQAKLLSGLLPICSACKKIRDDKGYWNQIESYIKDHSEAEFSHGICPDCAAELYPDFVKKKKKDT